MVFTPQDKS